METISRQVTLPTDLDEAWDLLTHPALTRDWLGAEVELPLVEGAPGTVLDHDGTRRHLVVEHVTEGERIAWRWWTDDDATSTRVEITLAPVEDGTRVTVTEACASTTARAQAGEAWSHRLLHLESLLLVAAAVRG
jgi:uncharacterized protein YndB with AHSA1/START domain